jgi:putative Ig domain-containing protein
MKIFRRGPGPCNKKNVLEVVLFLPLLVAAIFSSSGCAGVVSGGTSIQKKPALLAISAATLPGATAQTAYSASLSVTGGSAPYSWLIIQGSLPSGLSLSSAGQISGTPAQTGTFAFTVQVTDSSSPAGTANANLSITVAAAAQSPSITTTSLPNATPGTVYSATLQATGGTTPYNWTISVGTLPAGLTLVASTGVISGTPTTAGTVSFSVQVSDAANNTATKALSIIVGAAAQSPSVTTTSLPAATTGTVYSTTLQASGGTTPYSWSLSAGTLPTGLALVASTGVISGTPTTIGTASFTVQVTDAANNTGTKALTITVAAPGQPPTITTTSLPGATTGTAYSTTLQGTGGTTPYSWDVSVGTLPTGLSLVASTGVISGTPTAAGTFSFTVEVKDAANNTGTKVLSIVVAAQPPTITTSSLPSGSTGTAYSTTLQASGGTTPYSWSLSAGTLPAGLSLGASTGVISGTPTTAGTASFTVQVKDAANNTATKALSILVATTAQPPLVLTTSLPDGTSGTAYSTTVQASGGTTPYTWSVSAGTLPAGLSLGASTGVISGTPTTAGTASFTVQVKDALNKTATKALSITVAAAPQPPSVTTTSLPGGTTGTAYAITLQASGGTTPYSWSLSAGTLPAGLSLVASTGVISGTPTTAGTASFTVKVTDAVNNTGTKALSITVAAAPQPPTITTLSLPGGTTGTSYSTTLQASSGTTPYSWSLSAGSLPAGLSLVASTGVISGTPTTAGTVSFTVKVTDAANNTATKALSIAVAAAPQPPTITTTSLPGGTTGTAYSTTLQASGGTTPYGWSLSAGTLPAGLSLVASTGVISGTPTTAGTASFTVKVTDAANNTATKALSIAVAAAPQPPTITTTSLPGGTTGTAYSTTLQASGGTTPYGWSLSSGTLPAGLSLVASTGVISGTPTTAGTVSFTVKVTDAANNTATKALSIAIAAGVTPVQITTSSVPSGQVSVSYSTMIQATGGTTPYSWSISSGALPAGLTLAAATGSISGTPTASGSFSFTAKVTDSTSPTVQTATKAFNLTIAAAPNPVQITTTSLPSAQVSSSYSTTLAAANGTTPYSWSITSGSLPAGLTLTAATGVISGTPTTAGTSSFTVKVTDSGSPATSASANLSITVASGGSSYSVLLNWTASPSPGVTGYNVYRSLTSGTGYVKINSSAVGGLSYTDSTVSNSTTYYYVTTSVDSGGDESTYSEEVKMIIP